MQTSLHPSPQPPPWTTQKQAIATTFGQAAQQYHQHAQLQYMAAQHLAELIAERETSLPAGNILELGCGTGFLSQQLIDLFLPDAALDPSLDSSSEPHPVEQRQLVISDLAVGMLDVCQQQLTWPQEARSPQFALLDGEGLTQVQLQESSQLQQPIALIAANFVVQWFQDPITSLKQLLACLAPQGVLAVSFPSAHSFPEWQQTCAALELPYTANPLLHFDQVLAALFPLVRDCYFTTEWRTVSYASPRQFFQGLKKLGANSHLAPHNLTTGQMRSLWRAWPRTAEGTIEVSYHIVFLLLQR
ncbi:MAG: methyltransferase domain-containing protein [Cyanobacteria bacterium P01_H01_bin.121]